MSYKVVEPVFDKGPADPTELLILLAIAENANDAGYGYPGVAKLAHRARCGERQVIRLTQKMAADGWLSIIRRAEGFGKKQTAYQIHLMKLADNISCAVQMSHDNDTPEISCDILPRSHVTFEPISCDILPLPILKNHEPSLEPSVADAPVCVLNFGDEYNFQPFFSKQDVETIRLAYPGCVLNFDGGDCPPIPPPSKPKLVKPLPLSEQDVETIRLAYPRKVAPVPARKAILAQYALLVKGGVLTAGGLHLPMMTARNAMAFLLGRTGLYANSPKGMSEQFIPYPATWFNAGSYTEDESAWNVCSTSSTRQVAQITYSDPEEMNAR